MANKSVGSGSARQRASRQGVGRMGQAVAHHLEERVARSHERAVRGRGVTPVQPPQPPAPSRRQRFDVAVPRAVVGAGLDGAGAVVAHQPDRPEVALAAVGGTDVAAGD